ncbi:MAG: hypothetical protein IJW32_02195 [Clostridia bacterium]|nr:hypothetical protein [Clostridia bacterium]
MERYRWKSIPNGLSHEEQNKMFEQQIVESMMLVDKQLDEIKSIFNVQLEKSGDAERGFVVDQIIQYLYTNPMDEFEKSGKTSTYTMTLIDLADIIDAANKNDENAFAEKLKNLPWGDSNTGDQIAQNITEFAFWILSDESRDKLLYVFDKIIKEKFNYKRDSSIKLAEFDRMEHLYDLEKYNLDKKAEIAKIKPQQGEE